MTNPEMFEEFDVLYNSICSNKAPGLDNYEKSVLLTEAQEEFVRECYSSTNASFEITEEIRRSLDSLVRFSTLEPAGETSDIGGTIYNLPEDLWFITYESARLKAPDSCLDGIEINVVPVTQDEFNRVKRNPFRGFTDRRALRLDVGKRKVTILSNKPIGSYIVGYVVKPPPIILYDLDGDLKIDNEFKASECILNSNSHRFILERAVNKAANIYKTNQRS